MITPPQLIPDRSGRVTELEKKLDGLLSSIESRDSSIQSPNRAESAATFPEGEGELETLIDIHKNIFPEGFVRPEESADEDTEVTRPSSPWTNTATPESSPANSNLSQTSGNFLDSTECQKLLSSFREMIPYFPFLIIPDDIDAKSLSEEKHFLFLAIMAAASFSHATKFQASLDKEFRQALSTKVIMGGQKSLEIIQGIIVYLLWSETSVRAF